MSPRRGGFTGIVLWRALCNNGRAPTRTLIHCCVANVTEQQYCQPEWANGNFSYTSPERLHSQSVGCVMSPKDAADLEWPLSEGMQVSALPPVWIAMIISCCSVNCLNCQVWRLRTFVAQTVTIGEQKVCPESESLKFSTTPTPQVENPSDSDSSTPTPRLRLLDSDSSTPTPQSWIPPKTKKQKYVGVFRYIVINFQRFAEKLFKNNWTR